MKRSYALAAAVATMALGLTACGGGAQNAAVEAPALTDINPKDRAEIADGGTLRIAANAMPENWNFLHSTGSSNILTQVLNFTAPNNFLLDEAAKPTPNPNYVVSAEQTDASVIPQVVTLKLNKDAKWNSGRPITWEDYAATVAACNGESDKYDCASTDGYRLVEKVEKGADEFEVKITFKSSYPDWTAAFSTVAAKEAVETPEAFAKAQESVVNNDWLAGPFILDKLDKTTQKIYLKRNPNWWGETAKLDSVEFHIMEAPLIAKAFGNSEVDVAATLATNEELTQAQQRPDHAIRTAGSSQWRHFTWNTESGVLKDQKLRQALVRGINREAIAESDLVGLPVKPKELMLGNHFFMPGQEGYADNSTDYAYNPERAAKELDELGWKLEEGKKYRTKDGQELKIEYAMITGVPTSENEGKLLQFDMEQIGVNVVLKNVASNDFYKVLQERNFDVVAFTWISTAYPMNNIGQIYGCKSDNNYSNLCSEKIDQLRDKADVELDKAKRIEYANEADKEIWDQVMTLPIYRRVEFTAVPKNLVNYGAFGNLTMVPENVGFLKEDK